MDRGENCIMMNFTAFILHRILLGCIKSRRMWWARHVAGMGEGRSVYRVLVGRPEGRKPLEDLGVGGRITLRWTLRRSGSMGRTGFSWPRIGSSGGLL
jgi:hypothetical protein